MGRSYFNLWLKHENYSVARVNTIPTAGSALGIIAALATGIYADRTGRRVWAIVGVLLVVIVANILLTIWNLPKGALFFSYFLAYVGAAGSPLVIVGFYSHFLRIELLKHLHRHGVKRFVSLMPNSDNCSWRLRMSFHTLSVPLYRVCKSIKG
jgi:MFS family permease